jgi:hypothetical protein
VTGTVMLGILVALLALADVVELIYSIGLRRRLELAAEVISLSNGAAAGRLELLRELVAAWDGTGSDKATAEDFEWFALHMGRLAEIVNES